MSTENKNKKFSFLGDKDPIQLTNTAMLIFILGLLLTFKADIRQNTTNIAATQTTLSRHEDAIHENTQRLNVLDRKVFENSFYIKSGKLKIKASDQKEEMPEYKGPKNEQDH